MNIRLSVAVFAALVLAVARPGTCLASIAYGSINNFDTVNDTGQECHGFEIELEDCHSTDITYTFNYNHYGVPRITEDDSVPAHPVCHVFWESARNGDGSWAAFTAIPSGPISPTNGHQFTNPNVNFGGEHFGVGYRTPPTVVNYFWLVDGGSGNLVRGGQVQVATPTFTYIAPVGGAMAQVQAGIRPPNRPEVHPKEFGPALWVKEIRTTSHNNREVRLRDLLSDDPDDPNDRNWRNGEPDEVEVEWQLLQTEFNKADGGNNGELMGAPEDLAHGDEVVTRRYEFFEYIGPLDNETGEALAENVGPDDVHGVGMKEVNGMQVDLSTVEIVGEFKGAQMAAVDVDAQLGLIDHVSDGTMGAPYTARTLVIQGLDPFTATLEGNLPQGMEFDTVTGILSGTPTESGEFQFTVSATDGVSPDVSKRYTLTIFAPGEDPAPRFLVDTTAFPMTGGDTVGDGAFAPGTEVTVEAVANPGFSLYSWSDNGTVVDRQEHHTFMLDLNHSLQARFVPVTRSVPAMAGASAMITYTRPAEHTGFTYTVEVATSPEGPWNSGAGFTQVVSTTSQDGIETVEAVSLLSRAMHPIQYMRVTVEEMP